LFVGFLLVFVPARILERTGVTPPSELGALEVLGLAVCAAGSAFALWCIATFAVLGRGTPAPFDPPQRLVVRGPYRLVRNPMYLGAGLALCGAALYYRSLPLFGYAALFFAASHAFVLWYEEPALARSFGADYEAYRARVGRWLPRREVIGDARE
jgi:protein-S-isoprenylcysteine O-methyltransferase Ste14